MNLGTTGTVATIAYWVVFGAAWNGLLNLRPAGARLRPDGWSILLWCSVAVPSLLQFASPAMLAAGERENGAIGDGQWWRLLTAIFLQDGGVAGTTANLATLAVTVLLVQALVPGLTMTALFLGGGVLCNLLTVLTFGYPGAGNSMATMFLATAVVVLGWRLRGGRALTAAVSVLAGTAAVLIAGRDQHGLAASAGIVGGVAMSALPQRITVRPDQGRIRPASTDR